MVEPHGGEKEKLPEIVETKSRRRMQAEEEKGSSLFFGLGMFGMVGWAVAVPAVLGALLGRWLDLRGVGPLHVSWTLTGLFAGVCIGCLIAWQWIRRESGPPPEA